MKKSCLFANEEFAGQETRGWHTAVTSGITTFLRLSRVMTDQSLFMLLIHFGKPPMANSPGRSLTTNGMYRYLGPLTFELGLIKIFGGAVPFCKRYWYLKAKKLQWWDNGQ